MRHASVEVLSSYLDGELTSDRRRQVELHLDECQECRHRLEGLHGVVENLERLGRISPAPFLERQVLHSAATSAYPQSLMDRLEKGASRLHIERWVWMPTFGMVIALVSIIYLFSWGLERRNHGLPVVFNDETPEVKSADNLGSPQRLRQESMLGEAPDEALSPRTAQVGDRSFELVDGLWIEKGVDPRAPSMSVDPVETGAPEWLEQLPNLAELERLGGPVRLRIGDRLVQLEFNRGE